MEVSTHCPLHEMLGGPHVQTPPTHDMPCGQTLPHWPQLLMLLAMHWPLHRRVPGGHVQLPPTHTLPPIQTLPQVPQLPLSVSVCVSQPSTGLPLQSLRNWLHWTI